MEMLHAVEEGYEPRQIKLEGDGAVLGRLPSLSPKDSQRYIRLIKVTLPEGKCAPNLSRDHVQIEKYENQWFARDLGSNNGVFVDGQRLKKLEVVPLRQNCIIKLATSKVPSFEYQFRDPSAATRSSSPSRSQHIEASLNLKERIEEFLKCPVCQRLVLDAACLPCGHIFCCRCVKHPSCPVCQTRAKLPLQGFAARCNPVNSILSLLRGGHLTVPNDPNVSSPNRSVGVWIEVIEDGEEKEDARNKRVRGEAEEEENDIARCIYCGDPAHEKGTRCPHRDEAGSSESEASDLEDYL